MIFSPFLLMLATDMESLHKKNIFNQNDHILGNLRCVYLSYLSHDRF